MIVYGTGGGMEQSENEGESQQLITYDLRKW